MAVNHGRTEFKYDVFLSHNCKDKSAVEQIARLLRDKCNLKVWLDKWNLVPGEAWQEAIEDALDECQTFAVFLGPSGIGPWENEETRSAIEDRVQNKNCRVIPVLLPDAPDNKDLKLPRLLRCATWVDFRSALDGKAVRMDDITYPGGIEGFLEPTKLNWFLLRGSYLVCSHEFHP